MKYYTIYTLTKQGELPARAQDLSACDATPKRYGLYIEE